VTDCGAAGSILVGMAARSKKGWMVVNASLVVALILAILSVILALQNSGETTLKFLVWEFHGALALFLMGTMVASFAAGMLVMVPGLLRRNRALKRAEAERQTAAQSQPEREERQDQ
jgi:uncharacterized integral membrane protein